MDEKRKTRWGLLTAISVILFGGFGVWWYVSHGIGRAGPASNAIFVVAPYWYQGTWVFDDAAVGLKREPFVAGVPEMIDYMVKDIPDAKNGFRLTFSAKEFPSHQFKLTWLRGDSTGNFYKVELPAGDDATSKRTMEGWICPAMFRYYREAPKALYVRADAVNQ
jgi:hypothetical protein